MANILIIGCGYVGQALAQDYVKNGHRVFAMQRQAVNLPGVENILADVTQLQLKVLPKIDIAFYLVAPSSHIEMAYHDVYVKGLQNILALLDRNTQCIFVSSTAVYGQNQGEWVDEDSPTLPQTFAGKTLLLAEDQLKQSDISHKIVRFGGIYGPGRTHLINNILEQKAFKTPNPVYTNRIHLADCVGVLVHLATVNSPETLYLGVDNTPVLYNEVQDWLALQLNKPMPQVAQTMPARLAKSNKRCQNQRLIRSGYQMQMKSYREGYLEILNQIHENN